MVDLTRSYDESTVTGVPIDPESNNPIQVDQTSYIQTLYDGTPPENDGVGEDGFDVSVNLSGTNVTEEVNIAVVIDKSGSTSDSSGTDFNGDGTDETILEAELIAALTLFDAYVDAGYDPSEITISLTAYDDTATVYGSYTLDERADFIDALNDIRDDGPGGSTNFVAGLNSVDEAWSASGADPDATNIVAFLSDGEPWPPLPPQDIEGAREALEDEWGAVISGIGLGANSSVEDLDRLDNTGGADQVLSTDELLDIVVEPLTDAEFLRFEIEIEGFDVNGDPQTQTITVDENTVDANGDPVLITTQLGWSIDCLELDPIFSPTQDLTVTFNGIFAEDPGDPGSGEQVVTTEHTISLVICFVTGTQILTPGGLVAVEDLVAGDRVVTRDHGAQPIRWIGSSTVSPGRMAIRPDLRPVLIRKGALGEEQPNRDMQLSRQHRVLIRDWRAEMLFGSGEGVLVPAVALCNDGTITEQRPDAPVTYVHMLFDDHEIVYADGIETESFHPANRTVSAMDEDQRRELLALFPELEGEAEFAFDTARHHLRGREGRVLGAIDE